MIKKLISKASFGNILLFGFAVFICGWFRIYFTTQPIASVDLPGHLAVIEGLREHILSGTIRFFDPWWFTGWPALQFYAFFAHAFAALLAIFLGIFTTESTRLAGHLLMVVSLALLPYSMKYLVSAFIVGLKEEQQELYRRFDWLASLVICTLAFWFLNHDHQWFGIGAAGLLNVGLFSQGLAWHLLLLYLATILHFLAAENPISAGKYLKRSSILFALLLLTHSLTAFFGLFYAAFCVCRFSDQRYQLIGAHAVSFGLAAFWLVPFFAYSPDYIGQDIYRPTGDFLELFFRYPIHGLKASLANNFWTTLSRLDFNNILVMCLAVLGLCSKQIHSMKTYCATVFCLLLALIIFSSGYIASSLTIGLHYYRFYSYIFLVLTCLLAVVPIALLNPTKAKLNLPIVILTLAGCFLGLSSSYRFPHYERGLIERHRGLTYLRNENAVLDHLAKNQVKGRVLFEYFSDYRDYPFLSAHYMESELKKRTGRESINGLYIQSSLAYRMPVASAKLLGIPGYHIPLLFTDRSKLSVPMLAAQLREFGISHLVIGKKTLSPNIRSIAVSEPVEIGAYAVVQIAGSEPVKVAPATKQIIGYYDQKGNLPFHFIEFFSYAREELHSRFEFIELTKGQNVPSIVAGILINGAEQQISSQLNLSEAAANTRQIVLNYRDTSLIDHYSVWYQHNVELDNYNSVERYLEKQFGLTEKLLALASSESVDVTHQPNLELSEDNQSIRLSGMLPGVMYKVNYSFFPFWAAEDAKIFRGTGERMFVISSGEHATLRYSALNSKATIFGYLISVICVVLMWSTSWSSRRK